MDFSLLLKDVENIIRPEWLPLLKYHAELHGRSVCDAEGYLPYDWENIGIGYCYGPAFGHWDIIHQTLDSIEAYPEYACKQLANDMYCQQPDGLVPGSLWFRDGKVEFSTVFGHPPMWIFAVEDYFALYNSKEIVISFLPNLLKQIKWFESARRAEPFGYYYRDILTNEWESGVDEGIRFDNVQTGPLACIDATSHVYSMYDCAARWLEIAGQSGKEYQDKAEEIKKFIINELFSEETDFFHDVWSVNDPANRPITFDGFWPLVCGIASPDQAQKLIDQHLLNPDEFLTEHPVPSIAANEPLFEQRMWRGPAWNSMTYWIARGCMTYNRPDAAKILLEKALDCTAMQFAKTNTVWEYYHSRAGDQNTVQRKPQSDRNIPCEDYLGHNPLFAMVRLYGRALDELRQN